MTTDPMPNISYSIAYVLDGVVQDVLHTDARLAAILLSNPTVVDVTDWYANRTDQDGHTVNLVNATYDGVDFTLPVKEEVPAVEMVIPPQPLKSWVWDAEGKSWTTPIPYPADGLEYHWDEETVSWIPEANL